MGNHGEELKVRDGHGPARIVESDKLVTDGCRINLTPKKRWLCVIRRVEPDTAHALAAGIGGANPRRCSGDEFLQAGRSLAQGVCDVGEVGHHVPDSASDPHAMSICLT